MISLYVYIPTPSDTRQDSALILTPPITMPLGPLAAPAGSASASAAPSAVAGTVAPVAASKFARRDR